MIAADVMTRNVISVPPDAIVSDAVQLMLDNRISGLFVIDAQGALQGVITEGDLPHREEVGTGRRSSWWMRLFVPGREASDFTHNHSRRIADLMTRACASRRMAVLASAAGGYRSKTSLPRGICP